MRKFNLKVIKNLFRLICGALLLFGSNMVTAQTAIPEIDISKKYSEKTIKAQDIAEIEYIPLETTNEVLLDRDKRIISISDKCIVAHNFNKGDIFIFGRDGKVLSHFNHKGGSGEEYANILQVVYNETRNEVFVTDQRNRIVVYSGNGKFLRAFGAPEKAQLKLFNFDDKTFLACDELGLVMMKNFSKTPYFFISKIDGSIVSTLDLTIPNRYSPSIFTTIKGHPEITGVGGVRRLNNNWNDGQKLLVADQSLDTVYQLTNDKKLTPLIVRKPSIHNDPPEARIFLTPVIKTDKFIVFNKLIFDLEIVNKKEDPISLNLLYNFADGKVSEVTFENADCPLLDFRFLDVKIAKNTGAALIEPFQLFEYLNQGKVKGDLKQLAWKLKDDDNPVVMIIKFK
jgi:hypothetical protein